MGGRDGRPRARPRPGARRGFVLVVAGLVTLSLAFGLGFVVGRQWARNHPATAGTEQAKRPPASARRGLSDAAAERAPQIQEKLTFYQTLTAPLAAMPPPAKPEERVPQEATKDHGKAPLEPVGAQYDGQYTVQVVAYGTRPPADDLERKLKDAGYEAYVVPVGPDDGPTTYRVRVGTFATRAEAEQVAESLRSVRSLAPFVTIR